MSTRSTIAIELADGTVKQVYCHSDGYLSYNGRILFEHYSDPAKLEELIEQMPVRRKEIFLKRKKEGKSIRDIASEMEISPKTVENQITEAMNFLKKEFGNDRISGLLFFYVFLE